MILGVLGGGQLARMMALAAAPLGVRLRAYDPDPEACAGDVCECITGRYDDHARLQAFLSGVDVVTYEFENIPVDTASLISSHASLKPGTESLRLSQDRVLEKQALAQAGFEVAQWTPVDSQEALVAAIDSVGPPSILKTRCGGYDGKGQAIIANVADAARAWASIDAQPAILEKMIAFDRELSLVGVRATDGSKATYPLVENEHRQGILRTTIAPAEDVDEEMNTDAQRLIGKLLADLEHVGVLTIEFFEVQGRLVANEFAPRVHNSGHWTIDGAATSQFENHVRAVLDLPLGSTEVLSPTVMLNCVGNMPEANTVLQLPNARLHDYAKAARPGRKVGHVNLRSCSGARRYELAEGLGIDLG